MSATDELYAELKPYIQQLVDPLFEFSEQCLRKRGNFLPHGAILDDTGKLTLIAAAPDSGKDWTNSTEILPVLHDGLRQHSREQPLKAIGVAENVTVTLEGKRSTQAIKVLIEHRRGLAVALYLPFEKTLLRGYSFGTVFTVSVKPEVNAWSTANDA